jgi:hypothetical protein
VKAGVVTYNFTGKVISVSTAAESATSVIVGDTITGSLAYDSSQTGSLGNFTFTGSNKVHSLSFKIFNASKQQVFTDSYSGNISAYYAIKLQFPYSQNPLYPGITGTQMDIKGDTIYKQGLGVSGASNPAFDVSLFNKGNSGTSSLPTSSTITNFTSNSGLLTWDPPQQQIIALLGVPEPSGLVMGLLGLVTSTLGSLIWRTQRARATRS